MNIQDIPHLRQSIREALAEDVGNGDHSALSCIPADHEGSAKLLIKEPGVIAGIELAQMVMHEVDPSIEVEVRLQDGTKVEPGDIAFIAKGKTIALLQAERLLLNYMQRLSGIATKTAHYMKLVEGTKAKVLDTRKTTPGLRYLEKWAVSQGGGYNHRIGLFDMIMLKDNHIDFAGGITQAVDRAVSYLEEKGMKIPIEVETRNMDEVKEALGCKGVDRIMLDNFTPAQTVEAVKYIAGRVEVESSGGITEKTIRDYAECGVDFISVGALTHSVSGLDMSFKAL